MLERLVFTKNPCAGDFSKTPVLEEIVFFEKFPYRENNFPVCGPCVVVCEDFEFFQSSPVCGLYVVWCVALWCVETLKIFQNSPVCVGPVLWCVGTLSFSKLPCVWAPCCGVWGL